MAAKKAKRGNEDYGPDITPDIPGLRARENGSDPHGNRTGNEEAQQSMGGSGGQDDDKSIFGTPPSTAEAEASMGLKGPEKSAQDDSVFNPFGDKSARFSKTKNKFGKLAKNKMLIGALGVGGASTVGIVIVLVLLAGSLKIPNLAEHITTYAFAKVLRQATETNNKITYQRLALDALNDKDYGKVKATYQNVRGNTWGKMDKYRPKQVMKTLGTDGGKNSSGKLDFKYVKTVTGREQLKAVTIGNQSYLVKSQGYSKFIPGISGAISFKNDVQFSKQFAPAVTTSLRADHVGPITRGLVAKQIRKELGIGLVAWSVGKYTGKSEAKARLAVEREANRKIAAKGIAPAHAQPIKDAVAAAADEDAKALASDKNLQKVIDNGGSNPATEVAIEEKVAPTTFQKVIGTANSAYAVAIAACIIYDGSLTDSGPTINSQTESQQRAYHFVATGADQLKYGDTTGEAVGATGDKLGDITQTNPEIRASGVKANTAGSLSSQASTGGNTSILDVILGQGPAGFIAGEMADTACPVLTNIYVGVGGAVVLTALSVIPGFGQAGAAANGAVKATTTTLTQRIVAGITAKFATKELAKQSLKNGGGKAAFIARDTTKSAVKVAGLTILAKLIVMSKSNSLNNGLEQNEEFVHNADSGGIINANNIEQRQFYGRPLSRTEAGQNQATDFAYISDQNKAKPTYERYFALSNADSLLNRVAMTTASTVHNTTSNSILSLGSKLLSPLGSMGSMFGSLITPKSMAAATYSAATSDYGNVPWGYSGEEMKILRLDYTFTPLDNRKLLDESDNEEAINEKYHACFDGSKKIGDMLAEQMIVRDEDGNVDPNKGLCSPANLGPSNSEFGSKMVFRWRVAHNYDNGLDQLADQQVITKEADAGATAAPTDADEDSEAVSGDLKKLATEILANKNITYIFSAREDLELEKAGKVGTNGVHSDIRGLQIVAALGKKHKIVVSAFQSHGQGHSAGSDHYTGKAVDIANIDGQYAFKNITTYYSEFSDYAKGAVFLQGDCPGAKSAPKGMVRKPGDACHHQHISFK